MPPRTSHNLKIYRDTCEKVMARADNRCEVFVDRGGKACSGKPTLHRCCKFIPFESATYTNFLHKETRNGKSEEWVNDPDNIVFGCSQHHYEEEATGKRVEFQEYGEEPIYIAEE